MLDHKTIARLTEAFPVFGNLEPALREKCFAYSVGTMAPAGRVLLSEGERCANLPFVIDGSIRLYKIGETGREITLYRVERGDSCILSTTCMFEQPNFPAIALVEDDLDAVFVPTNLFRDLFDRSPVWRDFVFSLYAHRLTSVIMLVEEVAFKRMDVRIAQYLLDNADASETIVITHEKIAFELGSAREVVSRIMKDFERRKILGISRGIVEIRDRKALHRITE